MHKKYKSRYDCLERCKRLEFGHADKWYLHKPESVQENEILWDFGIEIDHPMQARRPDLILINKMKRTCQFVYFCHSSGL